MTEIQDKSIKTLPLEDLIQKTISIKKRFLKMCLENKAAHIGSSISCTEILTIIRFYWWKSINDTIILSKGHAAAALYSLFAEDGSIPESLMDTFYKDDTILPGHPPANKIDQIPFATGSLGHGLSLAAGLALSDRYTKIKKNVFCVTSDGELNEGSTWEAALFSAHQKLTNLYWLIDRNKIQGFGKTEDVMALEPLKDKIESFGWNVEEADGHDFENLNNAMNKLNHNQKKKNKPKAIICHTIKGKGMGDLENEVGCHYLPLDQERYSKMLEKLI